MLYFGDNNQSFLPVVYMLIFAAPEKPLFAKPSAPHKAEPILAGPVIKSPPVASFQHASGKNVLNTSKAGTA